MRKSLIVLCFAFISACDHYESDRDYLVKQTKEDAEQIITNAEDDATSAASIVRDKAKATGDKLRTWLITPLPPKKPNQPIAASYCYKAQTDVLCYRQPMPGWEHRLIAYQGTNALPPGVAQTQPLPQRVAEMVTPKEKAEASKPVFKELPEPPKPLEKDPDAPPVFDATHEQLPNPAHLPQL